MNGFSRHAMGLSDFLDRQLPVVFRFAAISAMEALVSRCLRSTVATDFLSFNFLINARWEEGGEDIEQERLKRRDVGTEERQENGSDGRDIGHMYLQTECETQSGQKTVWRKRPRGRHRVGRHGEERVWDRGEIEGKSQVGETGRRVTKRKRPRRRQGDTEETQRVGPRQWQKG